MLRKFVDCKAHPVIRRFPNVISCRILQVYFYTFVFSEVVAAGAYTKRQFQVCIRMVRLITVYVIK